MQQKTATTLPLAVERQPKRVASRLRSACLLLPLAVAAYLIAPYGIRPFTSIEVLPAESLCIQPPALFPSQQDKKLEEAFGHISSEAFRNLSVAHLSGAVQIKTESFDDLGPIGEDARWDVFVGFHAYLEKTFPLLHERLQVDKVNTHGLLYTWPGSDAALKPSLLMAHQDTVPVPLETLDAWTHPPWSGAYDGRFVWGRGSSDCKDQLIAVLEATELLLQAGFQPRRTILLAFGFDEETFGFHGAGNLSAVIRDRYSHSGGLAAIIDEGANFEQAWGTLFAKPGTAEKGLTNVEVVVRTPGGHSSIPQDHTSIGILSELITRIEASQYRTRLDEQNPYYTQLQCGAAHAPDFPHKLKRLLAKRTSHKGSDHGSCSKKPDYLALEAAKQGPQIKYLLQTSQAVDIISGGVKVNALPERVKAVINHRINVGETSDVVYDHLTAVAGKVASKYNLTLHAFDGKEEPSSIILSSPTRLDPSPVSPADGSVHGPFSILAGSIRAIYGEEVVVTPGIMTGNTDTRFFWDLTDHIFRFAPGYDPEDDSDMTGSGIHTINEKASVAGHINAVKFFVLYIRNLDEADL
ncbi:carboxypeptidase [Grosmannia clavigera kw1407]|uniref:Carboxypeptidase n=1 Tax=Grosmannia clavigera (strain kw1407 / UAMH 11150) TaxID=655863 RepID=F0X9S6_GROCL|nr:carboxypeptidase [Grosmannia clavigera kw1407]EFX05662.1 carboxypeptidase [Grosmannia clavigera kw1407]